MIRFLATRGDGRLVIGFGLSRENCERMLKGEPIRLSISDMGIEADVLLMAGETEAAMSEKLIAGGMVHSGTTIGVDPNGVHPQRQSPPVPPRSRTGDN